MSKQLKSILNKLPHATVQAENLPSSPGVVSKNKTDVNAIHIEKVNYPSEKMARIVAPIPRTLKREIKMYVINNPGETEKSLVLKGLRTLGFNISDEYISDKRKK